LSETDFAKQAGVQKDRFHSLFRNIKARQFNYTSLLSGEVSIQELSTSGNTIKITRDTRYPLDSVSKVGKYPHQLLMNLPFPVSVQTINLVKTSIAYKEISEQTNEAGTVQFTKSDIEIRNVKNRKILPGDSTTVNFSTVFIKEIPLKGSFVFYLDDIKKGFFSARGNTLKPFDVKVVNKLVQPLSAARFDKGTIHNLSFTLQGDNYQSLGDVEMTYDNLKVSLLKKKDSEYKKKDLLSLVANLLVVDKSNLNKKSDKQHAVATNKRDVYRSFFNHLWKTIMNGAQKIIT
jgi:hypothetical protein